MCPVCRVLTERGHHINKMGATTKQHRRLINDLLTHPPTTQLAHQFRKNRKELHLVGGAVRDLYLGDKPNDLDYCTDAEPQQIQHILQGWADRIGNVGAAFGTVVATKNRVRYEITTYRKEHYTPGNRKPTVKYGTDITEDLTRRDFTVNALAISLHTPKPRLRDPHNGYSDILTRTLTTPGPAAQAFSDDPLRMLRLYRFVSKLGFTPTHTTTQAVKNLNHLIHTISHERITTEIGKLLSGTHIETALTQLADSGLADQFWPELPQALNQNRFRTLWEVGSRHTPTPPDFVAHTPSWP